MDSFAQDLRHALRLCLRAPAFTLVAVAALALGIGANTAIFTVVHAVLLEQLPFKAPDSLAVVWEESARRPGLSNVARTENFLRWREASRSFESLSAFVDTHASLTGSGAPEEITVQAVTPEFFSTLGLPAEIGRTFSADEGGTLSGVLASSGPGSAVVILTHELWLRRFGGDPGLVGRSIQLNGRAVNVIGVMPAGTRVFFRNASLSGKPADAWLAMRITDADRCGRCLSTIARLKPGVTLGQARAEMSTIAAGLATEFPRIDAGWGVRVFSLRDELSRDLRPALLVLSGAVGFVLLIACANVANLLLARGAARRREVAIRVALGARRGRVVRQLLTESLVIGVAGGLAGLLVAQWSIALLVAISPIDLTLVGHVRLNYTVLAFTAAVSLLTAVLCGLAPAFESSRTDAQEALKDGARQIGAGLRQRRLRQGFVVAEVALAVVLLVGAGLLMRSLAATSAGDPGFTADRVLTARASVPSSKYPQDADVVRFFRDAAGRIAAVPGVESVGIISFLPLSGPGAATRFSIEGQAPPSPGQEPTGDVRVSDNGYFRTMGVGLVRGRLFTDREQQDASNVVVINEAMARRYFAGADPIGSRLTVAMTDQPAPSEIIGVVRDVKFVNLTTEARPMVYWPPPQLPYNTMTFVVRTASDPLSYAPLVERAMQAVDRDQPVSDVRTMDQWVARSLAQSTFTSTLLSAFAAFALLLAALGIYGVMSYAVGQRTSEIGIRLALGAETRDILGMVVGDGIRLAAAGLAVGVGLALVVSRTLTTLLYGTSGADPVTFAAVTLLLAGVAALASYLPARRASRIAPIAALRCQ